MSIWTTPERDALRKTVRDFAEREILPNVDEWERSGELPRELHRRAGDMGLLGITVPEEYGGAGLGFDGGSHGAVPAGSEKRPDAILRAALRISNMNRAAPSSKRCFWRRI